MTNLIFSCIILYGIFKFSYKFYSFIWRLGKKAAAKDLDSKTSTNSFSKVETKVNEAKNLNLEVRLNVLNNSLKEIKVQSEAAGCNKAFNKELIELKKMVESLISSEEQKIIDLKVEEFEYASKESKDSLKNMMKEKGSKTSLEERLEIPT